MRHLRSEFYQMIHSKLWIIHVVVPMIGILLFAAYHVYVPQNAMNTLVGFFEAVAMAFPFLIAMVISMNEKEEQKAGRFQRMLFVPYSTVRSHITKWIALEIMGLGATLLVVMGFGIMFRLSGQSILNLKDYFEMAVLIWASMIGLYLMTYIVSFQWGKGFSLLLGIVGSLLAALMETGLGEGLWQFIPSAWGIRLVGELLTFMINPSLADETKHFLMNDIGLGIKLMMGMTSIFALIFVIWSKNWKGGTIQEEEY